MTLKITPRMLYRMNKGLYLKNINNLIWASINGGLKEDKQLLAMVQTDREVVNALITRLRNAERKVKWLEESLGDARYKEYWGTVLRQKLVAVVREDADEIAGMSRMGLVFSFGAGLLCVIMGFWVGVGT